MKPKVPVVFRGKFPENFVNDVDGWSFSKEKLERNKGRILTLDIDLGNLCSLNCPHCFRRNGHLGSLHLREMNQERVLDVVKQAKKLGLESVKFLGAGEPFENYRFLKFLRDLKKMDVKPLIFTKGHVIGDDSLARKYFGQEGIENSWQLVEALKELGARIMLGFNSFDSRKQNRMVGGIRGYTLKRNRALEMLANAGFNRKNPTHLCLAANPVTRYNYKDVFEIYKWGRVRNIYVVVCPTMVSGRAASEEFWRGITPSKKKLVDLYVKIYKFNLEKGIQTMEDIRRDGIASYAGGAPCNQVACGMYVRLDGIVLRCPGDDVTILGNVKNDSLDKIWFGNENFRRAGTFNCRCPPKDGKSIPRELYNNVMARLEEETES